MAEEPREERNDSFTDGEVCCSPYPPSGPELCGPTEFLSNGDDFQRRRMSVRRKTRTAKANFDFILPDSDSGFDSSDRIALPARISSPMHEDEDNCNTQRLAYSFLTSKDWSLPSLLKRGKRFHEVRRVKWDDDLSTVIEAFENDGAPVIIEGWHNHPQWPKDMFTADWLQEHGEQNASARNVRDWSDIQLPLPELIKNLRATAPFATPGEKERLYGKDGDCPDLWASWLTDSGMLPSRVLLADQSDMLSCLPLSERVQTLMYYLGIGDTFTPFHKDLCASSGQNIMCHAEKEGSSFWFMTSSSSAPDVAEYFHKLKQELDLETHVVTVEELENAPFDVYIAEQKLGDLVLVPPRSCHQVVNNGGITIKISWSRMTLSGLETALFHELPIYRRVCRPEIYRVKLTIYYALSRYVDKLEAINFTIGLQTISDSTVSEDISTSFTAEQADIVKKLRTLVDLFDVILAEEYSPAHESMTHIIQSSATEFFGGDQGRITCDFCGADIFQSFFECSRCMPNAADYEGSTKARDVGDGIAICSGCYVEGRTCRCQVMEPIQCRPMECLIRERDRALKALQSSQLEKNCHYHFFLEDKKQILSEANLGIFQTACSLHKSRKSSKRVRRICRIRTHESHEVPGDSAIHCQVCHYSRCLSHTLEYAFLHSSEALILYKEDETGQSWHKLHGNKPTVDADIRSRSAMEYERQGHRPDQLGRRLAHVAMQFVTCKPINPANVKHGWYDKYLQTSKIPIVPSLPNAISNDDFLSDLTDLSSSSEAASPYPSELLLPDSPRAMTGSRVEETELAQNCENAFDDLVTPGSIMQGVHVVPVDQHLSRKRSRPYFTAPLSSCNKSPPVAQSDTPAFFEDRSMEQDEDSLAPAAVSVMFDDNHQTKRPRMKSGKHRPIQSEKAQILTSKGKARDAKGKRKKSHTMASETSRCSTNGMESAHCSSAGVSATVEAYNRAFRNNASVDHRTPSLYLPSGSSKDYRQNDNISLGHRVSELESHMLSSVEFLQTRIASLEQVVNTFLFSDAEKDREIAIFKAENTRLRQENESLRSELPSPLKKLPGTNDIVNMVSRIEPARDVDLRNRQPIDLTTVPGTLSTAATSPSFRAPRPIIGEGLGLYKRGTL